MGGVQRDRESQGLARSRRRDGGSLYHLLPGLQAVSSYQRRWLAKDVAAGVVLTTLLVPQGMAYAELAGLPAARLMIPTGAAGAVVVADGGESGRRHYLSWLAVAVNQAGLGTLVVGGRRPHRR
jgi:Sulfate permease family